MLKLLRRLLVFEAPQDSSGSDITAPPPSSSIRSPAPRSLSPAPNSAARSVEKTADAWWDSSRSMKLSDGLGSSGDKSDWGSTETEDEETP